MEKHHRRHPSLLFLSDTKGMKCVSYFYLSIYKNRAEKSLLSCLFIRLGENKRIAISRCFLYRLDRVYNVVAEPYRRFDRRSIRSCALYHTHLPTQQFFICLIFVCQFQWHNFVRSLPPLALEGFYVVSSCFLSFF